MISNFISTGTEITSSVNGGSILDNLPIGQRFLWLIPVQFAVLAEPGFKLYATMRYIDSRTPTMATVKERNDVSHGMASAGVSS